MRATQRQEFDEAVYQTLADMERREAAIVAGTAVLILVVCAGLALLAKAFL